MRPPLHKTLSGEREREKEIKKKAVIRGMHIDNVHTVAKIRHMGNSRLQGKIKREETYGNEGDKKKVKVSRDSKEEADMWIYFKL